MHIPFLLFKSFALKFIQFLHMCTTESPLTEFISVYSKLFVITTVKKT